MHRQGVDIIQNILKTFPVTFLWERNSTMETSTQIVIYRHLLKYRPAYRKRNQFYFRLNISPWLALDLSTWASKDFKYLHLSISDRHNIDKTTLFERWAMSFCNEKQWLFGLFREFCCAVFYSLRFVQQWLCNNTVCWQLSTNVSGISLRRKIYCETAQMSGLNLKKTFQLENMASKLFSGRFAR